MTSRQHFVQLAAYNAWANARIYEAAFAMPEGLYRKNVGVFFGGLHGTLNHLLLTDRIWLKRLTGQGEVPDKLDAILFEDRRALADARVGEDQRLTSVIDGLSEDALAESFSYATMSGKLQQQLRSDALLHLFNHQTHHRGHCHACCSILTNREPPSLDMVGFQRGLPAPSWPDVISALA